MTDTLIFLNWLVVLGGAYLIRDEKIVVQCVVMPVYFGELSIAKEIEELIR